MTNPIVPVRMDDEIREWLRHEAERLNITVSDVVRDAINLLKTSEQTS